MKWKYNYPTINGSWSSLLIIIEYLSSNSDSILFFAIFKYPLSLLLWLVNITNASFDTKSNTSWCDNSPVKYASISLLSDLNKLPPLPAHTATLFINLSVLVGFYYIIILEYNNIQQFLHVQGYTSF